MSRTGVVQWFSRAKGYGFIREDGGSDIFVHHSQIAGEGFRALETGERVRFSVGGVGQTLTVFQSEHGLFLPFVDATCGVESYEGGRYLEPDVDVTGKCLVDFNLAYNPFCAYGGPDWSCPIPPMENRLSVRIEAGEQRYK